MNANITISNLRDRPEFIASVADRIWRAWWEPHGVPLAYIAARVADTVAAERMPRAFVAHDGDVFAGTASVIASDLDERPQYTPWVAAVWIEQRYRSQRLGRRLIAHAAAHAFSLGVPRVFLTARPVRRSLYESLGWDVVEEGVSHLQLTIFKRDAPVGTAQ